MWTTLYAISASSFRFGRAICPLSHKNRTGPGIGYSRAMIDMEDIRAVEERSFNAWPARRTVLSGGWVFRLSDGYTKRANSANALQPNVPFAEVRAAAEALYARHDLPPVFRLSPLAPPEADRELDAAGYTFFDPSFVLIAPMPAAGGAADVEIAHSPSHAWLDGFAAANGIANSRRPIHDLMVSSIAMPAAFATLREGGKPIGFGLAVYERHAVGLFDIVIAPSERRRGKGRVLTGALIQWGRSAGARTAYLQVREQNAVARRLYAALGFQEAYRYHYRVPNTVLVEVR
jgi:ribosomal protein S18 acetylase RimI-like enzyme